MEILPIEAIKDDLEAMALLRMELFVLQDNLDKALIDFNLDMLRNMGATGLEYDLSERAAKSMSMLSTAREKIRKDGMIGQLELKSGVVETLDAEQYHEKTGLLENDTDTEDKAAKDAKQKQKELSVLFITNQMGARMRQISLAEEDFYYFGKEMLKLWKEREDILKEDNAFNSFEEDFKASEAYRQNTPEEFEEILEQASTMTESYLAGYLKVTNTIKDVVLKNHLLIVIHSNQ